MLTPDDAVARLRSAGLIAPGVWLKVPNSHLWIAPGTRDYMTPEQALAYGGEAAARVEQIIRRLEDAHERV
jgi:hypothetical protein